MTITNQGFAMIWAIPDYDDAFFNARCSSIVGACEEMLSALTVAADNVALRTTQLRRAGKLAVGLAALLDAYRDDAAAHATHPVSTSRARADEVEALVRAGGGPRADVIARAVVFASATGRSVPSRDQLVQAAAHMAARSLMSDREAALVRVMIQ